jgi:hypothetical protein
MQPLRLGPLETRRSLIKRIKHYEKAHALDLSLIFVPGDRSDGKDRGSAIPDMQPLRLGPLETQRSLYKKDKTL